METNGNNEKSVYCSPSGESNRSDSQKFAILTFILPSK